MNKKIIAMCATLALSGFVNAAEAPAESKSNVAASKSSEAAATVNGFVISKSVVDQIVKTYVAQGQKDTPALRKSVLDNLINRQVLAQESLRLGLDKTPAAKTQLDLMRSNFLASLVLNDQVEKNPIKDADLKAEYDRQVKALGNTADLMQYKISHVVLPSEAEAKEALDKIKKGESINQIAGQIAGNKAVDGTMDWILPNQVVPEISNVMVNLSKGSVCAAPIFTNGTWHIIKVDDKRNYKLPTFEESKNNVRAGLIQKKQADLIVQLRKSAKIQ